MKVIIEGKLPETVEFQGMCGHCKTVVQFSAGEAQMHSHRNETYYAVTCPCCHKTITVEDTITNRVTQ